MNNPNLQPGTDVEGQRQRGRSSLTWVLLVFTFLMVVASPTVIVLFFGLLPTVVAYIIDRTKGKSATFCVGSINFVGVFPYIIALWTDKNTVDAALASISDIFVMLVMYSAAAFGWLLFLAMPSVVSSFVLVLQERKVAQLRAEQKELIEEWGPDVAALVEMNHMEEIGASLSDPALPETS